MTAFEPYGTLPAELPDLLTELAAPRLPDYTDDVLAITAGTRQRPRWAHPERWLPMIITRQRVGAPAIPWRPILAVLVTLALLGGLLFVASQQKRLPPPFGPARNGAIVYDRGGDLFTRASVDAPERLLLRGPSVDFAPTFTRDGRHVLFLRRTAGTEGAPDERIDAFVADLDGSNPVDLTGALIAPNWFDLAPDDSMLIVHAADPSRIAIGSDDLRSKLYRVDIAHPSGTPQPIPLPGLFATTVPSFRGPDGASIVFHGFVADGAQIKGGLFSAKPDGTGLTPLTPTDGNGTDDYQQPLLSPDGRFLTYTNWVAPTLQIHILDLTTGEDRTVTEKGGPSEGFAAFSPDGTRIVFVRYYDNTDEIWIRPIEPGAKAIPAGPAYPMVEGQYIGSSFSPDGKYVIVNDPASKETRLIDAIAGGYGTLIPWASSGFSWQRRAP